eukprot:SAG31_NODE_3100_length_4675_cov_3.664117_2_plen_114_part_00
MPFCVPNGLEEGLPCRLPLTQQIWDFAASNKAAEAIAAISDTEKGAVAGDNDSRDDKHEEVSSFRRAHLAELEAKRHERCAGLYMVTTGHSKYLNVKRCLQGFKRRPCRGRCC